MPDHDRLKQLFLSQHPLVTAEEDDALEIVRSLAVDVGWDLWQWSLWLATAQTRAVSVAMLQG